MESRFIILHPDDEGEILLASALIRCLKSQVEGALVYSLVKRTHRWMLENNPYLDDIFTYDDHPGELLDLLKDFLPDYLIDLDGGRQVRRFRNRLKVLDFSINRKNKNDQWLKRAFDTCTLFDVHDDGKGPELAANSSYNKLLPSQFLVGYMVLSLDSFKHPRSISDDQIIQLAVMTEKPIVITGNADDRNLADRIGQASGCAVFPTCGDLTRPDMASVFSQAKGAIVFDPVWQQVAAALGIVSLLISENKDGMGLTDTVLWARSLFKQGHDRNTI